MIPPEVGKILLSLSRDHFLYLLGVENCAAFDEGFLLASLGGLGFWVECLCIGVVAVGETWTLCLLYFAGRVLMGSSLAVKFRPFPLFA